MVDRKPVPVLSQHVYGPGMPAYVVETPAQPGEFRLVFLDSRGHEIGSRPYEVQAHLPTHRLAFNRGGINVDSVQVKVEPSATNPMHLVLENDSDYYLQANLDRPANHGTARFQPGLLPTTPGSLSLLIQIQRKDGSYSLDETWPILCSDLPPHGRLEVALPVDLTEETLKKAQIHLQP